MVVSLAAIISVRAGKVATKEYVAAGTQPHHEESESVEDSEEPEEQEEWVDAEGNPIIGSD